MTKKFRAITLILCVCLLAAIAAVSFTACNEQKTYTITAQYDSSQGAVELAPPASGEEKYAENESVTVTVTPNTGYKVQSVKANGVAVAKDANGLYKFTVKADTTVAVIFEAVQNSVRLNYDNTLGSATLSAPANGEDYVQGESVTVTVTPNTGYEALSVKANGVAVEKDANNGYAFTVSADTTVEITFAPISVSAQLTFDDTLGNATLSAPADGESYKYGESVTLTVTPIAGFGASATFNTQPLTLSNNSATFTLGLTNAINVTFLPFSHPTADMYATLSGRVRFSGEYFYDATDDSEDLHRLIETVYAQDNYIYQKEADPATGNIIEGLENLYKRDPQSPMYLAIPVINLDNTIIYNKTNEQFAEYANPFIYTLNADDLTYVEVNKYSVNDKDKAKKAASAITGWNESINSFFVYFTNGVATKIEIVTAEIAIPGGDSSMTYHSTYSFTVSDHGTATVTVPTPFERVTEHTALENALQLAAQAPFYTIRHQAHELTYESEDLDYKKYVTGTVYFEDIENWSKQGLVVLKGYVYPFTYNENKVSTSDALNVKHIKDLLASFDLGAIATELFEYKGNNTYVLRNGELYAPYIAPIFANGTDEMKSFEYATSLTIILGQDGRLSQVKFHYATYGISENVVMTYDFDTPIDLSYLDFENADHHSILDSFLGQYRDNDGNYAIVDASGFSINGSNASITSFDSNEGVFTATWKEQTIYIRKFSQKQLLIVNEEMTIFWTLTLINNDAVTIPAEFKGHYYAYDEQYDEHFDFVIQSHAIYYNNKLANLISFAEREGIVAELDGKTVNLYFAKSQFGSGNALFAYIVYPDGSYAHPELEYIDANIGIEIPDEYVGVYISADGQNRVDITYTSISVNGKSFTPASYAAANGFVGTLGAANNYTIKLGDNNDTLVIGVAGSLISLNRTAVVASNYVGTWEANFEFNGTDVKPYKLIITDTSITVIKYNENGTVASEETFEMNDLRLTTYGYTFRPSWNGFDVNVLYFIDKSSGKPMLMMYDNNADEPLLVSFFKIAGSGVNVIPEGWDGIYSGTASGGTRIYLSIDDGDVFLNLDSMEVKASQVDYDEDSATLTVVIDGNTYSLTQSTGSDQGKIHLVSEDGTIDVLLSKMM